MGKSGRDFYIDCTGFEGLFIEEALRTGYEDWRNYLLCDRAIALLTGNGGVAYPYTQATALDHGWIWRIPLQHRIGNGYVYCNEHCGDGQAKDVLMLAVEGKPLIEPRVIPSSWYCIFDGMGVRPGLKQLQDVLRQVRSLMKQMAGGLPSHDEYLRKYCPSPRVTLE